MKINTTAGLSPQHTIAKYHQTEKSVFNLFKFCVKHLENITESVLYLDSETLCCVSAFN